MEYTVFLKINVFGHKAGTGFTVKKIDYLRSGISFIYKQDTFYGESKDLYVFVPYCNVKCVEW